MRRGRRGENSTGRSTSSGLLSSSDPLDELIEYGEYEEYGEHGEYGEYGEHGEHGGPASKLVAGD